VLMLFHILFHIQLRRKTAQALPTVSNTSLFVSQPYTSHRGRFSHD
jgi:hypothetical protein